MKVSLYMPDVFEAMKAFWRLKSRAEGAADSVFLALPETNDSFAPRGVRIFVFDIEDEGRNTTVRGIVSNNCPLPEMAGRRFEAILTGEKDGKGRELAELTLCD